MNIIHAADLNMGDIYRDVSGTDTPHLVIQRLHSDVLLQADGKREIHPFSRVELISRGPRCSHGPIEKCEHDCPWPIEAEELWTRYLAAL